MHGLRDSLVLSSFLFLVVFFASFVFCDYVETYPEPYPESYPEPYPEPYSESYPEPYSEEIYPGPSLEPYPESYPEPYPESYPEPIPEGSYDVNGTEDDVEDIFSCETRDDCLEKGWINPDDYCDAVNGDLVRPHLSCFMDRCTILEGEPDVNNAYRIDCYYGACYYRDDGEPKCCPKEGCPGTVIPGDPSEPGVGGGPDVPGIIVPDLPEDELDECETRDDCIEMGWEEPDDYCDAVHGDLVKPHLSCFMDHCAILEGEPDESGAYRSDCTYGACYYEEGEPSCCPEEGCPGIVAPGDPSEPGVGGGPGVPGVVIPDLPGAEVSCKSRDDCLRAGWVEPKDYCDEATGDVVRPHLSCFMDHCAILEGEADKSGAYRVDCTYNECYSDGDDEPRCCPADGCPSVPEEGIGIPFSFPPFIDSILDLWGDFWEWAF